MNQNFSDKAIACNFRSEDSAQAGVIQAVGSDGSVARAMSKTSSRDTGLAFDYKFDLPDGTWTGRLLAKSWGKSVNLICYFKDMVTLEKYKISAFKSRKATGYRPKDEQIDFSEADIEGRVYELTTGKNKMGNPAWISAKWLENH